MKKIIFSLLLGLGFVHSAVAAGDAAAGKAKSAMCAACHGADGNSMSDSYPNLAGQHGDYIAKQLANFKDGSRADPVMAPMAAGLSPEDMADLGAYFQSQSLGGAKTAEGDAANSNAPVAPAAPTFVADAAIGKSLYVYGDEARDIIACVKCHGTEGDSEVLVYPNLSKQHSQYIEKQLVSFRSKARENALMNHVANKMTDQDIAHLGAYLADTQAVADIAAKKPVAPLVLASDVAAGKAKSAACAACHGADGNALVTMYPKLAGQNAHYITKQLQEFKDNTRPDPVMAGMVQGLSEQDMLELGAFFSAQTTSAGNGEANDNGRKLYFGGDAKRGITACVACHGVNGKGMPNAGFPGVAAQNVEYLTSQLVKFRQGERANDSNGMMRNIAKKLKKKDIADLTQFMSSLK